MIAALYPTMADSALFYCSCRGVVAACITGGIATTSNGGGNSRGGNGNAIDRRSVESCSQPPAGERQFTFASIIPHQFQDPDANVVVLQLAIAVAADT